jgi:ElaB/YqjD/DUF883 family membrane-anchored ribosome-binding protein
MARTNGARHAHDVTDQLEALRKNVSALAASLGTAVAEQADGAASAVNQRVGAAIDASTEMLTEAGTQAGKAVRGAARGVQGTIERDPVTAMLVAAGVGFAIGLFTRRR